jgi:hypothetical protein
LPKFTFTKKGVDNVLKKFFPISFAILLLLELLFAPNISHAKTHTNISHDYEAYIVKDSDWITWPVGIDLYMYITVRQADKVITREELYTVNKTGCEYPFSFSLNTYTIKYYKNGAYLSTHRPSTPVTYITSSCYVDDYKANNPYSDLSAKYTYKAIGSSVYTSADTIPSYILVDTTEAVVD